MSTLTITSRAFFSPSLLRGVLIALVVWFVGMTAAALVIQPEAVVAFGRPDQLVNAAVEADGRLLGAGRSFVALRTGRADTVRRLYAGGAFLVWPVLSAGCGRARSSI